jgi:hypothetical protein
LPSHKGIKGSGSFVAQLVVDLRARRKLLEAERSAIDRALQALDPPARAPRRRVRLKQRILSELAASPGARGSHVALALGVDTAEVSAQLDQLLRDGDVVREGLGWRLAADVPSP